MNLPMSHTLVEIFIDLITYNLDNRGLTSLLATQKPIYSISVRPNNDFCVEF